MRIVFLKSNPIAPDVRTEKEMCSLANAGYEVLGLGWDREGKSRKEEIRDDSGQKITIHRIYQKASFGGGFKKNVIPLILFQLKLGYWLLRNRKQYDVIHACDLDTALMACIVSKIVKKKFIYDIFDYYVDCYHVPSKIKNVVEKIDHIVIKNAYKTIICTEKRKEQIGIIDKNDYLVIHNAPNNVPVDNDVLALKQGSRNDRTKIVYVGGLSKDRFIKELVNAVQQTPEVELHIGGFGPLEDFIGDIETKCDNIFFYGKISYDKTLSLENKCDYLAAFYPTDNRNHIYAAPNKFYEALMLKKPIIMVKGSGTADLAEEMSFGIFVDSSEKGVYDAVNIVKEKSKANYDVEKAHEIFLEKYQWSIMGEKLVSMYQNIDFSHGPM